MLQPVKQRSEFPISDNRHPQQNFAFLDYLQSNEIIGKCAKPHFAKAQHIKTKQLSYRFPTNASFLSCRCVRQRKCNLIDSTVYIHTIIAKKMKILIVYILMSYDGITSFHQGELRDVENIFGQSQSYGRMSEIWRGKQTIFV